MNLCSKPRCTRTGSVALAYDYPNRKAILHDHPEGELTPHLYALCISCAERLNPPRGWTLEDERKEPALFVAAAATPILSVVRVEEAEAEEELVSRQQLFFGSSN